MKVTKIVIDFELEEGDQAAHARQVVFENGMWVAEGPVYSRIMEILHLVWKLLRGGIKG